MRSPKVATLAARSSLPCCCTSAGSDVIRVFIRDVKQASRLGEKRYEGGVRAEGEQIRSRLLQIPGTWGFRLQWARADQEIRQQGEELTLSLIMAFGEQRLGYGWSRETCSKTVPGDTDVPNLKWDWLCLLRPVHFNTKRNPKTQESRVGS